MPKSAPRTASWRLAIARKSTGFAAPFSKLVDIAQLTQEALPLGLLDAAGIQQAVSAAYLAAPDFYDPNHYSLRYEEQLLPVLAKLVAGKRLLDLYCGQGREAQIFARAGYDVLGVDGLANSLERAREHATAQQLSIEFAQGDVSSWEPPHRRWDVVYTSLWMYSTLPDSALRQSWLRRLKDWLAPDGALVFSTTPLQRPKRAAQRNKLARIFAKIFFNNRMPEVGDRFTHGIFWHDMTPAQVYADIESCGLTLEYELRIGPSTPCDLFVCRVANSAATVPRTC